MFRYRLHLSDGTDLGESAYAAQIQAGMTIHHNGTTRYLVIAVVPFDNDVTALSGMLEVEPVN